MLIEKYSDTEITVEEFNNLITDSQEITVIHFFAEWCMNCLMISPTIEDLAEQMNEVKFIKMNVEDNKHIAEKYLVSKLPCIIIFKEGKEVNRIKGNQSSDVIESIIRESRK